jgi:hypothetical protein
MLDQTNREKGMRSNCSLFHSHFSVNLYNTPFNDGLLTKFLLNIE